MERDRSAEILSSMEERGRLLSLDLLRCFAVVLVLFRHVDFILEPAPFPETVLSILRNVGWFGVDLFFVLSGYLVSGLLFAEFERDGTVKPVRFLIRRGFKIYPPFYFFLITTVLLFWQTGGELTARAVLGEALFLQNYVGTLWPHTWSLAVEEHFYILLGISFWLMVRFNRKMSLLPKACLVLLPLCLLLRLAAVESETYPVWSTTLAPTHLRIDALAFGVLLAYLRFCKTKRFLALLERRSVLFASALMLLLPNFLVNFETSVFLCTVGFGLNTLGFGALLLLSLSFEPSLRRTPYWILYALARTGRDSYSIYLWHVAALSLFSVLVEGSALSQTLGSGGLFIALAFSFALLVGILMSAVIERPVLFLREKLVPRPAPRR